MAGKGDKEENKGKKDEEKSDAKGKDEEKEEVSVKISDVKYILYPVRTFFKMTEGEKDAIVDFRKIDKKIRNTWSKDFAEDLSIAANDMFAKVLIEGKVGKKDKTFEFFFRPDLLKWIEKKGKSSQEELDALFKNEGWKKLGSKIKEQMNAFISRLRDIDKLIESAEMMEVNENDYSKVKSFIADAMFMRALTTFAH